MFDEEPMVSLFLRSSLQITAALFDLVLFDLFWYLLFVDWFVNQLVVLFCGILWYVVCFVRLFGCVIVIKEIGEDFVCCEYGLLWLLCWFDVLVVLILFCFMLMVLMRIMSQFVVLSICSVCGVVYDRLLRWLWLVIEWM